MLCTRLIFAGVKSTTPTLSEVQCQNVLIRIRTREKLTLRVDIFVVRAYQRVSKESFRSCKGLIKGFHCTFKSIQLKTQIEISHING